MPSTTNLKELGRFLRSLRKQCVNEDSLPHRRRRTPYPGYQDVAHRVGIHYDTYAKIEQGKYPSITWDLLKKILEALHATSDQISYAFHISGQVVLNTCDSTADQMTPCLQRILDGYAPKPAYFMNKYWDIIGCNRAAATVFPMIPSHGNPDAYTDHCLARNVVYFMFVNPLSQQVVVEWDRHVQRIVAEFRLVYGRHGDDPMFKTVVDTVKHQSKAFQELWEDDTIQVSRKDIIRKEVNHPTMGRLLFEQTGFYPSHAPDLMLVFYMPLDEETTQKLTLLHQDGDTISDAA